MRPTPSFAIAIRTRKQAPPKTDVRRLQQPADEAPYFTLCRRRPNGQAC
jgi:hypothetical protein